MSIYSLRPSTKAHPPPPATRRSEEAIEFEQGLREHLIGQDEVATVAVRMIETYMAGMNDPNKPAGVILELGPTGTGKTHLPEVIAERLFGNSKALFKINCSEFQDGYQVEISMHT